VRLVDEGEDAPLELAEGLLCDRFLKLLGFKVATREKCHEVLQLAATELRSECDAEHVRVGRVVDVVVDVLEPSHLRQELR
jgi:hypothetical protein